ncbi:hypothetical protein BJ508DRAFT_311158 [Ascobolus immersus RN42]|uniref:Uncharacterized protein n=1 Tax=Ascobolus immersus RN42 TaxID=1160509 RepID=A0A3N4HR78_ASCIM|nr:hypothetical protein BJ508DRAFT_311158 [Ascobolus immersus RN42]
MHVADYGTLLKAWVYWVRVRGLEALSIKGRYPIWFVLDADPSRSELQHDTRIPAQTCTRRHISSLVCTYIKLGDAKRTSEASCTYETTPRAHSLYVKTTEGADLTTVAYVSKVDPHSEGETGRFARWGFMVQMGIQVPRHVNWKEAPNDPDYEI